MAESFVQVANQGSGPKLHTFGRVNGANTLEDEIVQLGEQYLASYTTGVTGSSVATATDHLVQLMAGTTLRTYLRRIRVVQLGLAGAVGTLQLNLFRLTTAGTAGTVLAVNNHDTNDTAFTGAAMALPTAKGVEGARVHSAINLGLVAVAPIPAGGAGCYEWVQSPKQKAIIIPAGVANGLALKVVNAVAGATCAVELDFDEANF